MSMKKNTAWVLGIVLCLIGATICGLIWRYLYGQKFDFGLVIDGGSSKSALHIYIWPHRYDDSVPLTDAAPSGQDVYGFIVKPGIATFANKLHEIEPYLEELLQYAKDKVPEIMHSNTPIFYKCTAGMRTISIKDQENIIKVLDQILSKTGFKYRPGYASVINGVNESNFQWIATNYLTGALLDYPDNKDVITTGSLDMGGQSTQIAFETKEKPKLHDSSLILNQKRDYELYSYSHNQYGLNAFKAKYDSELINGKSNGSFITNPCELVGWNRTIKVYPSNNNYDPQLSFSDSDVTYYYGFPSTFSLPLVSPLKNSIFDISSYPYVYYSIGGGNYDTCKDIVIQTLNLDKPCELEPCSIDGIYMPPITTPLIGSSNFYYVTSFFDLEVPILASLKNKVQSFCQLSYHNAKEKYPNNTYLPSYCQTGSYIYNFLTKGYHLDENTENISFDLKLMNRNTDRYLDVTWPLGYMIYEGIEMSYGRDKTHSPPMPLTWGIILYIFAGFCILGGLLLLYNIIFGKAEDDELHEFLIKTQKQRYVN